MIRVNINGKHYGDDHVLGNISFALSAGESLSVIGPSGVGKSTLLRLVAGLDDDFDGTIERCDRFSMVFQEPTLLPWRSVFKNLALIHPTESADTINAMLDRVGLAGKAKDWPGHLSLGQQRRLSLARAFLGDPELLILDEPFVSLDEATHADMIELTHALMERSGAATLLVTHDLTEARQLTDQVRELRGAPATMHENV